MTQKSAGMTFLNCCTMTLSYCYDININNVDNYLNIEYTKESLTEKLKNLEIC